MSAAKKYSPALIWILFYLIISSGLGFITRDNMDWYDTLAKSPLTPPDIVFPIVWSALYIMLAVAGCITWQHRGEKQGRTAFSLYCMQMFLNWGWTFVFFEFKLVLVGFYWILLLNFTMLAFITHAWNKYRIAALLVLPTLLWGSFAAYLNYSIWILN